MDEVFRGACLGFAAIFAAISYGHWRKSIQRGSGWFSWWCWIIFALMAGVNLKVGLS